MFVPEEPALRNKDILYVESCVFYHSHHICSDIMCLCLLLSYIITILRVYSYFFCSNVGKCVQ